MEIYTTARQRKRLFSRIFYAYTMMNKWLQNNYTTYWSSSNILCLRYQEQVKRWDYRISNVSCKQWNINQKLMFFEIRNGYTRNFGTTSGMWIRIWEKIKNTQTKRHPSQCQLPVVGSENEGFSFENFSFLVFDVWQSWRELGCQVAALRNHEYRVDVISTCHNFEAVLLLKYFKKFQQRSQKFLNFHFFSFSTFFWKNFNQNSLFSKVKIFIWIRNLKLGKFAVSIWFVWKFEFWSSDDYSIRM